MNILANEQAQTKVSARLALTAVALFALAGCDEAGNFALMQPKPEEGAEVTSNARSVKLIERDVEAPDAFQVTEPGLWDGRPSLGGVWVAHPDVKDPERVIIRNTKNGKFVIGALFRRERDNPGPALQISSDAAAALGMLAGAPGTLNVTALRREEVPAEPAQAESASLAPPAEVEEKSLGPIKSAAAAITAAETAPKPAVASAAAPKPMPASANPTAPSKPRASGLSKPYLQIGIFSVESNANNTAQAMRTAGIVPTVKKQSSKEKTFWRVLVGPANNAAERSALLKKIKDKGFADAYAVTN